MAPYLNMILKADINRIYDEKHLEAERAKNEKFFLRPNKSTEKNYKGKKHGKKPSWVTIGMGIDLPFCIIILVLLAIGLIMMFSASYPVAYYSNDNSYYYLIRQLAFAVVGLVLMFAISFFNYNKLHRFVPIIMAITYIALIIVLILPAGSGGVRRWIPLGPFNIQPSEIAKFTIVLFFAHWCSKYYDKMQLPKFSVLPGIVVFGTIAFLLYLEPHYSGIVIIAMLTVLMLYIGGMKAKYLVVGGVLLGSLVIVLALTGGLTYAMSRMDGWGQSLIYTTEDMWQTTWQTRNSLYAIGSGGLWGLGLGQSRQKFLYLPEPQNDFIFAIVVEELGLVGATLILLIFALLVWRGITLSLRAKDNFGKLLGIGLTAQIGLQVILNILVITDWLPNTGISLPFFSYGGSSLIMLLAQMGLVLSVSRTANIEKQ